MTSLESLMNAILTCLELASHTAASSVDGDKLSHGKASARQPPRVSSPVASYGRLWNGCRSDAERRQVISDALVELRSIRYSKRLKGHESRELRIEIGMSPGGVWNVAYQFQCSTRHVYRCRAEARRLPESVRRAAIIAREPADDRPRK